MIEKEKLLILKRTTSYLYISTWLLYAIFAFFAFPILNSNTLIPCIILITIGGWLYKRSIAILFCFPALALHFSLNQYYADQYIYYSDRLIGEMLCIGMLYISSTFKRNLDGIKTLSNKLDKLVSMRTEELQKLTDELLTHTENIKITHGQSLHDGMGQQLTGIQLLCASLSEELKKEANESTPLVHTLEKNTTKVHNQIRHISRMHFPLRVHQVGLIPSLNELSDCIQEIKPIHFSVQHSDPHLDLPQSFSLQLYRICQETSLHAIDILGANSISIQLKETTSNFEIEFEHNGSSHTTDKSRAGFHLIRYRLQQVYGDMETSISPKGINRTKYQIPKPFLL